MPLYKSTGSGAARPSGSSGGGTPGAGPHFFVLPCPAPLNLRASLRFLGAVLQPLRRWPSPQ
eukprot:15462808-Alexandrium_andersonii.AAC.1